MMLKKSVIVIMLHMRKIPLLVDSKALKLESISLEGNQIILVAKTIQQQFHAPDVIKLHHEHIAIISV